MVLRELPTREGGPRPAAQRCCREKRSNDVPRAFTAEIARSDGKGASGRTRSRSSNITTTFGGWPLADDKGGKANPPINATTASTAPSALRFVPAKPDPPQPNASIVDRMHSATTLDRRGGGWPSTGAARPADDAHDRLTRVFARSYTRPHRPPTAGANRIAGPRRTTTRPPVSSSEASNACATAPG